ncbi:YgjV family protein [Glaciecola sp. 1036]|uniref:YgjV family protein n=1 Tax=Alteromonadaceae TaxID=72275 RepID=UPI003D020C53
MPELNLAQAIGLLSYFLGILTFFQHDDKKLKVTMLVMNLNHALHFILLGATVSCLSALLSALRTGLSIYIRSAWLAWIFIFIAVISGVVMADHWFELFAILGVCIGTYALFCLHGIKMRIAFLLGAFCWLTNNILVGSIGGTLLELTLIAVNLNTIRRLLNHQKQHA